MRVRVAPRARVCRVGHGRSSPLSRLPFYRQWLERAFELLSASAADAPALGPLAAAASDAGAVMAGVVAYVREQTEQREHVRVVAVSQ